MAKVRRPKKRSFGPKSLRIEVAPPCPALGAIVQMRNPESIWGDLWVRLESRSLRAMGQHLLGCADYIDQQKGK